jgi:ATP-dependent helicase/nuclease subunit B
LLDRYRVALGNCPPGSTLWLAPTSRAAADIQDRLLAADLRACFSPGVTTFARFANSILAKSHQAMRPVTALMKRQLIRQLLEEQRQTGRLQHFGPISSTAGLLDLLCDFIRQMKRLEIWPEKFDQSCHQRGVGEKDRELISVYQTYQQRLVTHHLYDSEGLAWSARDLLRQQPTRYELVVADGFSDFTQTEHDMLQTLAEHAEETWMSLPLDAGKTEPSSIVQGAFWDVPANGDRLPFFVGGREDLFQKPLRTRDELRRRHPNLREETAARPGIPAWPALSHLERTIFSNPRGMKPAPETAGLEIMACGRQIDEVETIGRRIKRLLIHGHAEPGQIAVAFRRVQPLAGLVREVFQRLGIPFYLENVEPLGSSPPIAMLLRLLELDAEDWPMHNLLAVLGNNYFSPDWAEWDDLAAGPIERTIRGLQIPRGRDRLLERVASAGWVNRIDDPPTKTNNNGESATYHLVRGLADELDKLPKLETLAAHASAWNELADRVGIFRAMRGDAERSAWELLREALGEGERLAEWLGQDAPRLDRAQAREALVDIINSQTMRSADDESGRVRVLSAASVRHLKVPYLFLAGLSERAFPAAESDDGVYSHAERQRLIEAGLPCPVAANGSPKRCFFSTRRSTPRRAGFG